MKDISSPLIYTSNLLLILSNKENDKHLLVPHELLGVSPQYFFV